MTDATMAVAFRARLGGFELDAAFTAPIQGVTALIGPSGCGKTTVLRCIAGLQRVADGLCDIGGDRWQDGARFRPTHRRPIGYVFQEPSLFAHLTVRRNLLFGARRHAGDIEPVPAVPFDDTVVMLGLEDLLERSPATLSGGQRQRVAIGRALLSRPALLLMDEPLSALDQSAKAEILPFLERVTTSLAVPTIYVSHDPHEVERLADTLVLMKAGRVIATGALTDLQSDPALPLLASRDAAVTLHATVKGFSPADGLAEFAVHGGTFLAPSEPVGVGTRRRLRIAATDVSLTREHPAATTVLNIVPVRILAVSTTGPHEKTAVLGFRTDSPVRLLSRITLRSWRQLGLAEGDDLYAQVKGMVVRATSGDSAPARSSPAAFRSRG